MKQVALVTGGTRGIGKGIAIELAKAGFNLAINGVREEQLIIPVLEELKKIGTDVIYCQGDISSSTDRKHILDCVENHFGKLNVLINNGGIAPKVRSDLLETTEESFEQLIQTNLQGTYFLTQQAARRMIRQVSEVSDYRGCIITISSISGLSMMTKLFATRMGEYGIPVYEVQPGIIATDMTAKVKEKYDALFANGITIENRWGYPEDVAKAVATLAKGEIPYATGQVLTIDGGLTIERL